MPSGDDTSTKTLGVAKPADLPVKSSKHWPVINLKTANRESAFP
jgi:hypothetical protein